MKREVRIVRILNWDPRDPTIHVGCAFERTLTEDEIQSIGIPLPVRGETAADVQAREPQSP